MIISRKSKFVSLLLSIITVLSVIVGMPTTAQAASASMTLVTASSTLNLQQGKNTTASLVVDITLGSNGTQRAQFEIYDKNNTLKFTSYADNPPAGRSTINIDFANLPAGTYTVKYGMMYQQNGNWLKYAEFQSCTVKMLNTNGIDPDAPHEVKGNEPNENKDQATQMTIGVTYNDEMGNYDKYLKEGKDNDYYKVNLTAGQTYWIILDKYNQNFPNQKMTVNLYLPSGSSKNLGYQMSTDKLDYYTYTATTSGTHYIAMGGYSYLNKNDQGTAYTIKVDKAVAGQIPVSIVRYQDAYGDKCEPNNAKDSAVNVTLGTAYNCELGKSTNDKDWFKFDLTAGKTYNITIEGYNSKFANLARVYMVKPGGSDYGSLVSGKFQNATGTYSFTPTASGTYYIRLEGYNCTDSSKDTSYNFYVVASGSATPTTTPKPTGTTTTTPKPTGSTTTAPTTTAKPTGSTGGTTTKPTGSTGSTTTKPTGSTTPIVTTTPNSTITDDDIEGFAERLYTTCLGRAAEPSGKAYWADQLRSGKSGAEVAKGFFFSTEFINKNLSDTEFVKRLYRTFMDREADDAGLNYWLNQLKSGKSRLFVYYGFVNSTEWANVCLKYGILSGGTGTPTFVKKPSQPVIDFATRMYTTCLGRNADIGGRDYWASQLANMKKTGTQVAYEFFFSAEFKNKNLSNKEYIRRLYQTFMGRDPDTAGYTYWLNQMSAGKSREEVFYGFATSKEFAGLCAKSGILA